MTPPTTAQPHPQAKGPKLDAKAFEKVRRIAPNLLAARRAERDGVDTEWHARPLPEEVAFKLTNRCDLRCEHCYQWNGKGYHHGLGGGDLDLAVVEKVLAATRELKSNVYLWGGEPLVYRQWNGLVDLLERERRWTSVCTNGTMIERRLDGLLRISERLELVVAVDGFEAEHDALRGRGAFARMMGGLRALAEAKRAGTYRGEITVNCVFQDAMIGRLFDLVGFLEEVGVETVYLSFPWHLSDATSARMDGHVAAHFPWLEMPAGERRPSWHSYKFRIDPARLEDLRADLARIDARRDAGRWRVKLRYNPKLAAGEMAEFLAGGDRPAQNKTRCVVHRTRMDVFPGGDVVSCKFFPEFTVGNLTEAEVAEVWQGAPYDRVRETVARCGLMPVCAKCNLLYTRGL
ncbi:radical SAM protein [Azospirillum agricola]|uniref:radical SAM protein n=1 Tax=Azospirillum agricola TaxID=1720247 RepID=UPI000A0EF213|nr:radical SAM protein [Azospirillum agricola]SMH41868.1 radical SAM additional 4Fe4S-binding SPASM domain-containing protein [Azospirillum lipoferum]